MTKLYESTWQEVENLPRETTVTILPFAAIEQHGPHLPIGTDSLITAGLADALDGRMPEKVLILPVQRFGSSPHHMVFSGSLTLTSRTFLDVAVELAGSLHHHGFRRGILLNGHGGNQALLDVATQEIRLKFPDFRIVHATYWVLAAERFAQIRESPPGGMGHAGEMETSIVLHLRPDLERSELAGPDGIEARSRFDHKDMLEPARVGQFRFWNEMSAKGVLGDPATASAEKGKRFLDAATDALVELVEAVIEEKIG